MTKVLRGGFFQYSVLVLFLCSCLSDSRVPSALIELVTVDFSSKQRLLKLSLLVDEPKVYASLSRVELGIQTDHGHEVFRGVLNLGSDELDLAPGTFGVFELPSSDFLGEEVLVSGDPEFPLHSAFASLLPGTVYSRTDENLLITWVLQVHQLPDNSGRINVFARGVPQGADIVEWEEVIQNLTLTHPRDNSRNRATDVGSRDTSSRAILKAGSTPLRSDDLLLKEPIDPTVPRFQRVFDLILLDEDAGRFSTGLSRIPEAFEDRALDREFLTLLEVKRAELLNRVIASGLYQVEGRSFKVSDLEEHYARLLAERVTLSRFRDFLPFERFLYLHLAYGTLTPQAPDKTVPDLRVEEALQGSDPWAISSALFVARKLGLQVNLEPIQSLSDSRPELWDIECEKQAQILARAQNP